MIVQLAGLVAGTTGAQFAEKPPKVPSVGCAVSVTVSPTVKKPAQSVTDPLLQSIAVVGLGLRLATVPVPAPTV